MDILSFIFVGLCVSLLLYCVLPRTRRWMKSTTCNCGYDVESLTGYDPHGPGLSGTLTCPECGSLLTLRQVRVRGEMEVKYAPRGLSLVVVGIALAMLAFVIWRVVPPLAPIVTSATTTATTIHSAASGEVRIAWTAQQKWVQRGGVIRNDVEARITPAAGRSFVIALVTEDYDAARGWRAVRLRDHAGTETKVAAWDMPDVLVNWLGTATDVRERADGLMVAAAFADGMSELHTSSRPWGWRARVTLEGRPAIVSMRSYRWYVYPVGIMIVVAWLALAVWAMRAVYRRQPYTLEYTLS
ncbi:MAG: hypothetical protein ACK5ZG_10520 [Phycisphaerae bacterium]